MLLQVGFNRRFDPGHKSVRDAVAAGTIGNVHLVRISSRDPQPPARYLRDSGGLFLDTSIHDFDMARYVTGSDVVEVFARGAARIDPASATSSATSTRPSTLVHEDGALTTIDNSRRAVYGYDQRVEAFGSAGVASSGEPAPRTGRRAHRRRRPLARFPTSSSSGTSRATSASGRPSWAAVARAAVTGRRRGRTCAARARPCGAALGARGARSRCPRWRRCGSSSPAPGVPSGRMSSPSPSAGTTR